MDVHVTTPVVREVLLRWQSGASIRAIARAMHVDRKTVRRYLRAAHVMRLERWMTIDDDTALAIASVVRRRSSRVSATRQLLEARRERIRRCLAARLTLARIHASLVGEGVYLSYATLRRFAIAELGWRVRPIRALASSRTAS
jgi:IS30 family transposase